MPLILASASPRRRELLAAAGLAFVVEPVEVDERALPEESPREYVERVARLKATAGAARASSAGSAVLGADTTVVVDGDVMGKPIDDRDAMKMLRRLAGRSHEVLTGVALSWEGVVRSAVACTEVWFTSLDEDDMDWYVRSGEPRDKAGAYAIQGLASRFVTRIDGSYSNVVGLPVAIVLQLLAQAGLSAIASAAPAPYPEE